MVSQQELQYEYGKDFPRFPSSRILFMTWKWQGLSAPPPNLHHLSLCHLKASQSITQRNDNQPSKDVVCRAAVIKKHQPRRGKKLLNSWETTHFLISPADSLSTGITLHFSMLSVRARSGAAQDKGVPGDLPSPWQCRHSTHTSAVLVSLVSTEPSKAIFFFL